MSRLRQFVVWLCGVLVLASASRPFFTAVHNRIGKAKDIKMSESASVTNGKEKSAKAHQLNTDYGKLPIYFEPNLGQTDSQVKFIARGSGATTFLTATRAVFSLSIADLGLPNRKQSMKEGGYKDPAVWGQQRLDLSPWHFAFARSDLRLGPNSRPLHSPQSAIANRPSAISMKLVGANPTAQIEGLGRLPGMSNYFIGNDPAKWRTNIPHYAKVRYHDVYPGIDLDYYGNEKNLEYDFVVQHGANPSSIRLAFEGTEAIQMNPDGDLILRIGDSSLRRLKPRIYQENDGQKQSIPGRYALNKNGTVTFELETYDLARAIVIDPILLYSTYLGGIDADAGNAIAVDNQGYAYLTGYALSRNFPLKNPYQGPIDTICRIRLSAPSILAAMSLFPS